MAESKHIQITIKEEASGKEQTFTVRSGIGFQALCARHQTPIEFDCREADCGICIFKVLEGMENLSDPTPAEKDFLRAMQAESGERLACQSRIFGHAVVLIEDVLAPPS